MGERPESLGPRTLRHKTMIELLLGLANDAASSTADLAMGTNPRAGQAEYGFETA
jgi:hypothetical protein